MGPILWVNGELVALQHLFLPVEIYHSVYLRSTLIQGQPHEGHKCLGLPWTCLVVLDIQRCSVMLLNIPGYTDLSYLEQWPSPRLQVFLHIPGYPGMS